MSKTPFYNSFKFTQWKVVTAPTIDLAQKVTISAWSDVSWL